MKFKKKKEEKKKEEEGGGGGGREGRRGRKRKSWKHIQAQSLWLTKAGGTLYRTFFKIKQLWTLLNSNE